MRAPANESTVDELARAARAGDAQAWDELLARYGGMVRAVVMNYRLQEADAADVVQSTWLRAVEQIGHLREPERFGGWLRTIARRECLTVHAQRRRELLDERLMDILIEPSPGPEALALRAETVEAVRVAVNSLSGRSRVLVDALFYQPVVDYAVVAHVTDMPLGSIGPTRARTLSNLRMKLERRGFVSAGVTAAAG